MTCKAASFGAFAHKRLKTDPGLVDATFEVQRGGRHDHLSILMCGTKQKTGGVGHRDEIPHACGARQSRRPASLRRVLEDGALRPLKCCRQTRSSGTSAAAVSEVGGALQPLTLCWLRKKAAASAPCAKKVLQTKVALRLPRVNGAGSITFESRCQGRKRGGDDDCNIVIKCKRRRQENDPSTGGQVSCSEVQQLQPLACSLDQAMPLNDDQRDVDLEEDTAEDFCQRNEVTLRNGAQPGKNGFSAYQRPGNPFDQDSDDPETRLEKQRRYREGLERGMAEFLHQTLIPGLDVSADEEASTAADARGQVGLYQGDSGVVRSNDQVVPRTAVASYQLTDESHLMLEAAQGFVVMIDGQLRILYVSENVHQHLGHDQVNMLGQNIQEYIHPKDVPDFVSHLKDKGVSSGSLNSRRMFYVGMKFCFQKAGSRHKETGYTFVQWNSKLQLKRTAQYGQVQHLVALCRPVRTDSILELRLDGNMFISRHDLSFHFIYCDPRIINLIGYEPSDLIGRTAYQFHCPRDILICKQCHKLLILSGSSKSDYYRFLSRTGQWVWLCTHATIVYDTTKKPQYVVCKNYVISEQEAKKKLAEECKEFMDMKCLGFSLETDLPACDGQGSKPRSLSIYGNQEEEDGESLVNQVLSTQPVDVSNNPYARPRKKRNSTKLMVKMGVPVPIRTTAGNVSLHTSVTVSQDISTENSKQTDLDRIPRYDQIFTSQSQLDDPRITTLDEFLLPTSEDLTVSFSDMLEVSCDAHSSKTPLELQMAPSVDDQSFNGQMSQQVMFSENQDPSGSFDGYKQFDFLDMMDCTPNIAPASCDQSLTNVYIKTTTNTFSRRPAGNISVLPNILPAKSLVAQSPGSVNESPKFVPTSSQNPFSSSKLFSLLKSSSTGEAPAPAQKVTVRSMPGTTSSHKANVSILKDVFLSQDKSNGSKHFTTLSESQDPARSAFSSRAFNSTGKNGVTSIMSAPTVQTSSVDTLFNSSASDVSSVMTDGNSDPFLSELTDPDSYMMEDDLCPKDLTDMPMLSLTPGGEEQLSEKVEVMSSVLSSSDTTFSCANMKELDTFLGIISPNCDSMMPLNDNVHSQTIPFTEQLGFSTDEDFSQSITKTTSVGWVSNESSSDSDTSGKPSLLRSLLDKEGQAIQGPLTYKEWIMEEALRKKNELKKQRVSRNSSKHSVNPRLRGNKPIKSTELPLPKSHLGSHFIFGKDGSHQRKPTKELPLPLSAQKLRAGQADTSQASFDSPVASSSSNEEMNLPDDLLDLAVEYCASLGPDQAEALLSDLNDSTSFEDNLYSLIASPAQPRSSTSSSFAGSKQISLLESTLSTSLLGKRDNFNDSPTVDRCLGQNTISILTKADGNVYKSPSAVATESGKMSLLRAAVTSPDVDKLIEQIPFGNIRTFQQSPPESKSVLDEPDVLITKVNGLQKMSMDNGQKMSMDNGQQVNRVFKVPCASSMRSSGNRSPSKSFQNAASPLSTSDHIDAILFDHFYTASISMSPASPKSPSVHAAHSSSKTPGSVLSPWLNPDVSTVHKVSRGSVGKQKSGPNSPRSSSSSSGHSYPSSPRSTSISYSDLSSTHPISVMIMKKDNHRSRRSKSIGLQTDNEPGEVYPEFERSPSDTILYPSAAQATNTRSPSSSPSQSDTSGTTSLSSSPTMSELEKFLRGFSSHDESCHSADDESRAKRSTPFLQKLLTGELSNDNYQRIDQQMLERERRESISSGSDYDFN